MYLLFMKCHMVIELSAIGEFLMNPLVHNIPLTMVNKWPLQIPETEVNQVN